MGSRVRLAAAKRKMTIAEVWLPSHSSGVKPSHGDPWRITSVSMAVSMAVSNEFRLFGSWLTPGCLLNWRAPLVRVTTVRDV